MTKVKLGKNAKKKLKMVMNADQSHNTPRTDEHPYTSDCMCADCYLERQSRLRQSVAPACSHCDGNGYTVEPDGYGDPEMQPCPECFLK